MYKVYIEEIDRQGTDVKYEVRQEIGPEGSKPVLTVLGKYNSLIEAINVRNAKIAFFEKNTPEREPVKEQVVRVVKGTRNKDKVDLQNGHFITPGKIKP